MKVEHNFGKNKEFGYDKIINREFKVIIHYKGWNEISLGFSIDIKSPNVEIHLPFLFIRIGWCGIGVFTDLREKCPQE